MQKYACYLRAVNVGGTGKLPMSELKKICEKLGFKKVKTYIASGNVIFETIQSNNEIKSLIENELLNFFGKETQVFIRDLPQLKQIIENVPFENIAPNRLIISLIDEMPQSPIYGVKNQKDEQIIANEFAIYTYYGDGMANSKLNAPWFKISTGRNLNTIRKMVEMLEEL